MDSACPEFLHLLVIEVRDRFAQIAIILLPTNVCANCCDAILYIVYIQFDTGFWE